MSSRFGKRGIICQFEVSSECSCRFFVDVSINGDLSDKIISFKMVEKIRAFSLDQ